MASAIGSLKIRQQILLVTLPPLFSFLIAMGLCFYFYWAVRAVDQQTRNAEESIAQGESLLRELTEMNLSVHAYISTRQPELLEPYTNAARNLDGEVAGLRQLELEGADPSEALKVDSLRAEIHRWQVEWAEPLIAKVQRGETFDELAAHREGRERMVAPRVRLLGLIEGDTGAKIEATRELDVVMRRVLTLGVGAGLFLAAAVIYLTRAVTHLITQPVQQLIEASERVSRGDFQPLLPPPVDNEFGVLSQSFSHMTAALRREREELAALNSFSEVVAQCTSEREVHDHLLHWLKERFQPRQVIIFKLHDTENLLEAAATLAPLPEEVGAWPVIEEPHKCKAVRSGRSLRMNDVTAEPQCPSQFALPAEGSYYCGPLIAGGIIIGAVRLEGAKNFWTPEKERLLESYLSGAASALSNLRLLETMKQQANIDVLTGLYNRRFLEDYARKLFAMARRREQPVGVIMMDLDHFKDFNDLYSHEVGDRILRQFAKTVTSTMRETNLAARFGGEEFVVLLPDTGPKACLLVAERIRQAVLHMTVPASSDKPLPRVTVSLGIAIFPEHGQSLEEILQASDKALYESKRAGRNRTTLYVPEEAHPR